VGSRERAVAGSYQLWRSAILPGLLNSDNLFVPFFTTKHGGSGIGLILSRQIAEAHGGVLQLANRTDRTGCEAVLALPITYDAALG
jgi:nitrogen-specific signal transduction histidine kinase